MEFPPLMWTGVCAGILGLMQIVLSIRVARQRHRTLTNVDMTAEGEMGRRIRARGNFSENVPVSLILLALSELAYGSSPMIGVIAGMLVLARFSHAWAMARGWRTARVAGTAGTFTVIGVCAMLRIARPWLSLQT